MLYYTYVLIDPVTRQPFYVGKGTGNRMYHHWRNRNAKNIGNPVVKQKLKQIEVQNLKPIYERVLFNVDEKTALYKEQELIQLYGRLDIGTGILCNFTDGGERGSSSWSPQTRKRKSEYELARKKGRPVSQHTLDGVYVQSFTSSKVASEHVKGANRSYITQVCRGKRKSAGGFIWTYSGDTASAYTKQYYHPVNQHSLDGRLLQTFPSLTHAQNTTGVDLRNISNACRGRSSTAGGFIWKYV